MSIYDDSPHETFTIHYLSLSNICFLLQHYVLSQVAHPYRVILRIYILKWIFTIQRDFSVTMIQYTFRGEKYQ
ncbi:hypothetical protein GIB67_016454 [Kingdonia uniflora]|uniref:Uncharacterized protein n=1 Tax=Kingdonia uniflora TaxID=39325 RepID=A0A7J7MHB4_9MAGN|nr:hypothetical protein GIB67_016454 [Kingdonia uniflora]